MSTDTTPLVLTSKTLTPGAPLAVVGPAATLKTAYESGSPVTLTGKLAGEVVHLGYRRTATDGTVYEIVGEDRPTWTHQGQEIGSYLIDVTRLDQAPHLAEVHAAAQAKLTERANRVETRAAAEDERLDNLAEDGA